MSQSVGDGDHKQIRQAAFSAVAGWGQRDRDRGIVVSIRRGGTKRACLVIDADNVGHAGGATVNVDPCEYII